MRISDGSSDVCSSDLIRAEREAGVLVAVGIGVVDEVAEHAARPLATEQLLAAQLGIDGYGVKTGVGVGAGRERTDVAALEAAAGSRNDLVEVVIGAGERGEIGRAHV